MRTWAEAINNAINIGLLIVLAVLALVVIMDALRSNFSTWRESHRKVRRSSHDKWVDFIYEAEGLNDISQDKKQP